MRRGRGRGGGKAIELLGDRKPTFIAGRTGAAILLVSLFRFLEKPAERLARWTTGQAVEKRSIPSKTAISCPFAG